MGVFSSYGTVSSLTGTESVLVSGAVTGNPDGVLRATTAQIAALGGGGVPFFSRRGWHQFAEGSG